MICEPYLPTTILQGLPFALHVWILNTQSAPCEGQVDAHACCHHQFLFFPIQLGTMEKETTEKAIL